MHTENRKIKLNMVFWKVENRITNDNSMCVLKGIIFYSDQIQFLVQHSILLKTEHLECNITGGKRRKSFQKTCRQPRMEGTIDSPTCKFDQALITKTGMNQRADNSSREEKHSQHLHKQNQKERTGE